MGLYRIDHQFLLRGVNPSAAISDHSSNTALDLQISRIFRQPYCRRLHPRAEILAQHISFQLSLWSFGTTTTLG